MKKNMTVTPDGFICLGDPNVLFSTKYCVKTEEEKQAILDGVAEIYAEAYYKQELKKHGIDPNDL